MPTGFLLDIQGLNYGLVSHSVIQPTFAPSSNILRVISSVPNEQTVSYDPKEGLGDNGGSTIQVSEISSIIEGLSTTTHTVTTAEVSLTSTSPITVSSTTGFPSSGKIWMGGECIEYVGTTATTFGSTSITRSRLNTRAEKHEAGRFVYQFNPFLIGRKCWLYRVDLSNVALKTLAYVGYLDSIDQDDSGYTITLLSGKKLIEDAQAFSPAFVAGKIYNAIDPEQNIEKDTDLFLLSLTTKERRFQSPLTRDVFGQIGDEIIRIIRVDYPSVSGDVASTPSAADEVTVNLTNTNGLIFRQGDLVDFVDGSGNILEEAVRIVSVTKSGTSYVLEHTGQTTSLTTSDKVQANYSQALWVGFHRGYDQTVIQEHDKGADFAEVRFFGNSQSHTIFDFLMQVLISRYGDGTNDPYAPSTRDNYDVLPEGWGVGLSPSDDIDLPSFQRMEDRASSRAYRFKEPVPVKDILRWFSFATNSAVYWSNQGKLTCAPRGDIYPFESGLHTLDSTNIVSKIPSQRLDVSQVINVIRMKADYQIDGEPLYTETILHEESVLRYGKHEIPDYEDKGIKYVRGISEMTAAFEALLTISAYPTPLLTLDVVYDENVKYNPADLVSLTLAHAFNAQGNTGYINDFFEVLDATPSVMEGVVSLTLKRRAVTSATARINIAGIVASKSGSDVTIRTGATSFLAPENPKNENGFELDNSPYLGEDDIDYFKQNDAVELIDVSDIGAGNTTATTTISSINYATNTMTLAAVPAWLAAGDWIRLDNYTAVQASAVTERIDFFAWLSSNASPPLLGGADDSLKWGS